MNKSYPTLIFLFLTISLFANDLTNKIIIDTDVAIDDLRAICYLLASDENEILAITTSDGAVKPAEGLIKVRALLHTLGHEGIPTAMGVITQPSPPSWWEFSKNIYWGDQSNVNDECNLTAPELMIVSIETEPNPVTIVCLGSMTNTAKAIQTKPELKNSIKQIVWYNDDIHPATGVNYGIDTTSANFIFNSDIKITVVSNEGELSLPMNNSFINEVGKIKSPYSKIIKQAHLSDEVKLNIKGGHLKLWDDMVATYIMYPGLFHTETFKDYPNHSICFPEDSSKIISAILKTLTEKEKLNSVFTKFPNDTFLFQNDLKLIMPQTIENYGFEEWRVITLTSEIHGHLGIYSIIGAKMGLRAKEYFRAGDNELIVHSFAGDIPPLSCLNDGLQVGAGSTLGRGLITVEPETQIPKAIFTYKNLSIEITLEEEFHSDIIESINNIIQKYGLNTEEYWSGVRKLALTYWKDWDRRNIFEIKKINNKYENFYHPRSSK